MDLDDHIDTPGHKEATEKLFEDCEELDNLAHIVNAESGLL